MWVFRRAELKAASLARTSVFALVAMWDILLVGKKAWLLVGQKEDPVAVM
jgi:hypothetical protein